MNTPTPLPAHPNNDTMPENFNEDGTHGEDEEKAKQGSCDLSHTSFGQEETSLPSRKYQHSKEEKFNEDGTHGEDEKAKQGYYDLSRPSSGQETSLPSKYQHSKEENASLILGAERTLFAALNNAWLLAIGGIGLMSVGNDDERATNGGALILSLAIASTSVAYGMHVWRVNQIKNNQSFQFSHSIVWSSMIVALTITTLVLELYFGVLHPYLEREKTVTIAGGL